MRNLNADAGCVGVLFVCSGVSFGFIYLFCEDLYIVLRGDSRGGSLHVLLVLSLGECRLHIGCALAVFIGRRAGDVRAV